MWFIYTIITILLWGGTDLFYKLSSNEEEAYSHLKITVCVGIVMGVHAISFILISKTQYKLMSIIQYLPVSLLYILAMVFGYIGLRYIRLSIASPIGNSSGAIAFILCFIFLRERMTLLQLTAVIVISIGIFVLAVIHKREDVVGAIVDIKDEKYSKGALAILFPIFYCIIDGAGTFADAMVLDRVMKEEHALISYELTFLTISILVLFWLLVVKKQRMEFIKQKEGIAAAVLETAGQFFYVKAMAVNAMLTAPLVACYSIASILLSRIFLKEKLTVKQYLIIALIVVAIGILGIE